MHDSTGHHVTRFHTQSSSSLVLFLSLLIMLVLSPLFSLATVAAQSVNPQVSASPNPVNQGTILTLSGSGFTPNGAAEITISYANGRSPATWTNNEVDSAGAFTNPVNVTSDCGTIMYYQAKDVSSGETSNQVTIPVDCSQGSSPALTVIAGTRYGEKIKVRGEHFPANGVGITVQFFGPGGVQSPYRISNRATFTKEAHNSAGWGCGTVTVKAIDLATSQMDEVSFERTGCNGEPPPSNPGDAPPANQTPQCQTVNMPFSGGPEAVTVPGNYAGNTTIEVSGVGQAAGNQYSDAFYIFANGNQRPIRPVHPTEYYNWVLWINGQHAEAFIPGNQVPAYREDHRYTFQINAPGGPLTFGIGDISVGDNTGSYTINVCSTTTPPPEQPQQNNQQTPTLEWIPTSAPPVLMSENDVAAYNGRLYLVGGWGPGGRYNTVYYATIQNDGSLGAWVQTTPLPTALADHTAVAHNGFLYAIGGHTGGSTCVKTVWYAPINADGTIGQWATTASLPENTGYTSVVIHNNHMLIAGGQNTTSPHTRRTSVYHAAIRANGTLGSWQATTPLPETMSTLGTVITINDWVYVLGGINRAVYAAQMKGDASISTWHAATSLPAEMKLEWATGRAAVNGWIYTIAGGQNGQSAVYMSRANGASLGDWQSTTAIPRALGGEAVVVYNNIIYVIGGDWRQASAFYGKVR